jgi:hypothetical protein
VTETPAVEPRLPHDVYPAPDLDTGTAAEWSTYHLVRACAYGKLMQHVILGDDPLQTSSAILGFIAEFAQHYLLARVSDDVARDLAGILDAGDIADEIVWDELSKRGIHPDTIARFLTHAESAAKRAAIGGDGR